MPPPVSPSILDVFRLDGRRALVTGGGGGLGRVIAEALSQVGADVALASRTLTACERAAAAIADSTGGRTCAFAADVRSGEDVRRLVTDVERAIGPIDILFNNAGINIRGAIEHMSEEDWDAVVDTNLKGAFLLSRALGPAMARRGWGRIVNMGSIMGAVALPGRAPYASAKAGLMHLTRVLALEWAGTGVTVNALCPGVFGTEINRPLMDDPVKYQEMVRRIPMGRWGELGELAGAALFLASGASSYVTGISLFVDGGYTAW